MNLFEELYLSYVNDFLTRAKFAEYYRLTEEQALIVINKGREYHEKQVAEYKRLKKGVRS